MLQTISTRGAQRVAHARLRQWEKFPKEVGCKQEPRKPGLEKRRGKTLCQLAWMEAERTEAMEEVIVIV